MANDELWASDLPQARRLAFEARAGPVGRRSGDRNRGGPDLARIDIVDGRFESGLSDGMRAAREARDAGYDRSASPASAISGPSPPDHGPTAAESRPPGGPPVRGAIEQSHCRQDMSTTAALLDWAAGHWDAADERARHGSSIGLYPRGDRLARCHRARAMGGTGRRLAAGSRSRSRPGAGSARCSSS